AVSSEVRADVSIQEGVTDLLGLLAYPDIDHPTTSVSVARRPHGQPGLVGPGHQVFDQILLALPNVRRTDLSDDVQSSLSDEGDGRCGGAVLEPPSAGVVVEVLQVEGEGLARGEPPGHQGLQGGEQVPPRVEERQAGSPTQPF